MQQSAPTAAVQPQPQQQGGQAGQGGANYPMASLYVGDLGKYNIIFYRLFDFYFLLILALKISSFDILFFGISPRGWFGVSNYKQHHKIFEMFLSLSEFCVYFKKLGPIGQK